jgi:hypothetical protein
MAGGKVILGRYGESGEAGWTHIVPDSTSVFFYVSSSHPSATDHVSNPGTDPATPLLTISRAGALCGARSPRAANWVLLAEGDTFSGDDQMFNRLDATNGYHLKGGLSWNAPFVITSYNPNLVGLTNTTGSAFPRGTERAANPRVEITNVTQASVINFIGPNANQSSHYAIIGIDFYCPNADPINNPGDYDDTFGGLAMSFANQMGAVGERVTLLVEDCHFIAGITLSGSSSDNNHSTIVRRCSFQYTTSQGVFVKSAPYMLIEECSFRHCGWIGGAGGNPDQLTRSSGGHNLYSNFDEGRQQRRIARGIFSYDASNTGVRIRHGGEFYDNLCVECSTGIEACVNNFTYVPTRAARCSGEFSVHDNVVFGLPDEGVGIWFPGTTSNSGPAGGEIKRNLVAHAFNGISCDDHHVVGSGDDINVCVHIVTSSQALYGGNTGSVTTSTAGMPDSTYVLADYATDHMGLADEDTFLTNKFAQRRYNFDQRYMPWYINNIIRPNYSMSGDIDNRPTYYAASTPIPGRFLKL